MSVTVNSVKVVCVTLCEIRLAGLGGYTGGMRHAATLGILFAALLGPFGCVDSSEAPPPPPTVDGSTDGFVRPPVGPGQDQGHPSDGGGDGGGVGCLNDPQDVRVLFVLDRSDTMAEFTTGGDGAALNVVASTAAADLIASLPDTSQAGLLLFPSQTFDEPDCPGVDALAQQYPLREASSMEGVLRALWSMQGVILGKPRARAMQRAAEGLTETDLSDTLVVLLTDTSSGCVVSGTTDGVLDLEARGARVVTATLATSSAPASGVTPARYSTASEVLAALQPALDAVRYRCETP